MSIEKTLCDFDSFPLRNIVQCNEDRKVNGFNLTNATYAKYNKYDIISFNFEDIMYHIRYINLCNTHQDDIKFNKVTRDEHYNTLTLFTVVNGAIYNILNCNCVCYIIDPYDKKYIYMLHINGDILQYNLISNLTINIGTIAKPTLDKYEFKLNKIKDIDEEILIVELIKEQSSSQGHIYHTFCTYMKAILLNKKRDVIITLNNKPDIQHNKYLLNKINDDIEVINIFTGVKKIFKNCDDIYVLDQHMYIVRRKGCVKNEIITTKLNNILECAICYEEIKQTFACSPCGHTNTCATCLDKISKCPSCRTKIESKLRIY